MLLIRKNGDELCSFDYTGFFIGILEMVFIIPTGRITPIYTPINQPLQMAQMDVPSSHLPSFILQKDDMALGVGHTKPTYHKCVSKSVGEARKAC